MTEINRFLKPALLQVSTETRVLVGQHHTPARPMATRASDQSGASNVKVSLEECPLLGTIELTPEEV